VLGIPWVLNGVSASVRTIQGDIVVEKFLELKGPRGTYSQVWISRADPVNWC